MRFLFICSLLGLLFSLDARGAEPFASKVMLSGLEVPWDLAFAPDGTLYFTERPGHLSAYRDGKITRLAEPETFQNLRVEGEVGLMGLALAPDFSDSAQLYLCYGYWGQDETRLTRVSRFSIVESQLIGEEPVIDAIPGAGGHSGCRLSFGPDGKLYATMGDTFGERYAQDTERLQGKILRVNPDGSIPEDNPFANAVWSYGHRNPQGLVFHPSGRLYSTEHGPDKNDELNLILKAENYGWPEVQGKDASGGFRPALEAYTPTIAIAGMDVYEGDVFPEWQGDLLFVSLKAGQMYRVVLKEDGSVASQDILIDKTYGRLRDVAVSPSGQIFIATSNRNDRNPNPDPGDDRIIMLGAP